MIKKSYPFQIDSWQFLDENSQLHGDYSIPTDTLLALYQHMVHTRLFDQKAIALQRTGKLGTFPSSQGQEAIYTVLGHLMHTQDILCPYYRDQAAFLLRGVKMEELLAYWGGDERGNAYVNQPHDFPISVPIASQCLHAVGAAYALQYKQQKRAVVATIGEGGTSKGDFYEAMNFASLYRLPVIFVINNNQWAISVPSSKQSATQTYAQKAIAADIPATQVDGNDVFALHHAMQKALQRAYQQEGPTVIEAVSFRLCDHTTADDASRYIPQADRDAAANKEPIKRLQRYLMENHLWDEKQEQQLLETSSHAINSAVERYLQQPKQPPESMLEYLYAELPEALLDQYAELEGNT